MPYNECEPRLHTEDEDDTAKVAAAAQATCARVANLVRIKIATDMWTHHALYQAGMVDEDFFFFQKAPGTRSHLLWDCEGLDVASDRRFKETTEAGSLLPPCLALLRYSAGTGRGL